MNKLDYWPYGNLILLYLLDSDKTLRENAWWILCKDAVCFFGHILETAPYKTAATVQPLFPILQIVQVNWTRHPRNCSRNKDEHISSILQQTHKYRHISVKLQTKIYINQLCANTGCSLEDLRMQKPKQTQDKS